MLLPWVIDTVIVSCINRITRDVFLLNEWINYSEEKGIRLYLCGNPPMLGNILKIFFMEDLTQAYVNLDMDDKRNIAASLNERFSKFGS